MDDDVVNDKDCRLLSKGINLKELMSPGGTDFQIDIDFQRKNTEDPLLMVDEDSKIDVYSDESDDAAEVLRTLEHSAERQLLMSPEYVTFDQLAATMTDCIPSGEVKMLIVEEGEGPLIPYDGQVTMHYAAYWEKESVPFDSTLTMNYGSPMTYKLGTGRLIPGLEVGLTLLHGPQARAHILIAPSLAWGPLGAPPRIRPEKALFTISVVDVQDVAAAMRFNDLPREEQQKFTTTMTTVKASNQHAKILFQKKQYEKAIKNYHKSLTVLQISRPQTDEEGTSIKEMSVKVYMNLALCYYKIEKPNKIILMLDDLARITNVEKHCKALFYYGRAFQMQGHYEQALKFYKKALKLEPRNSDIGQQMASLDDIIKTGAKNEKKMCQNIFSKQNGGDKNDDFGGAKNDDFDDVDDDFKSDLLITCESLMERTDYAKFELPKGLTKNETDYIKSLVKNFGKLTVLEDGDGSCKKISIVKRV